MHRVKLGRCTIDVKVKNVGPVVVPCKIVPELHLNAKIEIAFRIEDAFIRSHRPGNDAAQRIDDQRAAATIRIAEEFLA